MNKHTSDYMIYMVDEAYKNLESELLSPYVEQMEHEHFRYEFGTVRLHMPRRYGHTTAAVTLLQLYPGSIMFVPSPSARRHTIQEHRDFHLDEQIIYRRQLAQQLADRRSSNLEDFIFVPQERHRLLQILPREEKRPMIILDGASRMKQEDRDTILHCYTERTALYVELQ